MFAALQPDSASSRPVYRQLSDGLIRLIHDGRLPTGTRLPGSRKLATQLGLNRKTVIAACEDVRAQGYLEARPGSGYFVVAGKQKTIEIPVPSPPETLLAGFPFDRRATANHWSPPPGWLRITEGSPDVRLADLEPLYVEARRLLRRPAGRHLTGYGDGQGDLLLREKLAAHLQQSRGIPASPERLLITRGSQHGFQLASRLLFRDGGVLAATELSYDAILHVARDYGAEIIRIPHDAAGMCVAELPHHPRFRDIRAVYLTPHHHYPTTVTLSAERRLHLLELSREANFAILEDDYDYDFHYGRGPQLPLAALDTGGRVLYLGSFTKILAPNLRIGYLYGPEDFVGSALRQRLLTDRQGDLLLERALARYLEAGDLERHLRRVRPVYRARRDLLLELLHAAFGDRIAYTPPSGGMAAWVRFPNGIDYEKLTATCQRERAWISPTYHWWRDHGSLRLGFAALNEEELRRSVRILGGAIR